MVGETPMVTLILIELQEV